MRARRTRRVGEAFRASSRASALLKERRKKERWRSTDSPPLLRGAAETLISQAHGKTRGGGGTLCMRSRQGALCEVWTYDHEHSWESVYLISGGGEELL